jgi:restriction system protein
MFVPFLRLLEDGRDHSLDEVRDYLATHFGLTPEERRELASNGKQTLFNYRVAWAQTHLSKALLVERPKPAVYRVTERGREVLRQNPASIDREFLSQFSEYRNFLRPPAKRKGRRVRVTRAEPERALNTNGRELTPEEALDRSYQSLREARVNEILERLREVSPTRFEQIVVDVLLAMGYGGARPEAGRAIGRTGDGGVDGLVDEDRLGLDRIYVQAKRWKDSVPVAAVSAFAGALMAHQTSKGVFITTSDFTKEARAYVSRIDKRIALVDGKQLAGFMFDYGVGMIDEARYIVKKLDPDYFADS